MSFLTVTDLRVAFPTEDGLVRAVDGVNFTLDRGETLAIVGESGSGKSVTSLAIMGLHNRKVAKISGSINIQSRDGDVDVVTASDVQLRNLRGRDMAMIFQDPMTSLHPYYSIGDQLAEAYKTHNPGGKKAGIKRAIEMLDLVGIPEPQRRVKEFPHQFSGGMRQRAMIAMALINNPTLLIADEPTTALDVTVQAQILGLLNDLQKEFNMAVILITHDLGIVAQVSNRVQVMYAGNIVESGSVDDIYYRPLAPYTIGLLSSIPSVGARTTDRLYAIPGQPPSLINLPSGCPFRPRCEFASQVTDNRCATEYPDLREEQPSHSARCHLPVETRLQALSSMKGRAE